MNNQEVSHVHIRKFNSRWCSRREEAKPSQVIGQETERGPTTAGEEKEELEFTADQDIDSAGSWVYFFSRDKLDASRAEALNLFSSGCKKAKADPREKDFIESINIFFASRNVLDIDDAFFDELVTYLPPGMEDILALVHCKRALEKITKWGSKPDYSAAIKYFAKFCFGQNHLPSLNLHN